MLVIVAPGQGAQTPGFLTPWLEDRTFASRIEWLVDRRRPRPGPLRHRGRRRHHPRHPDRPAAAGRRPAWSPRWSSSRTRPTRSSQIGAVAGHSVGELTAAAGARVITAEQAMVLVRERGKAMAEAAAVTPTGMTAVLGGDRDEVLAALEQHGLTAANDNGPGQIVAAGTLEQLEALAADAARQGPADAAQRRRRLPHRAHGARPSATSADLARSVSVHDPRIPVISNKDGNVVHDGREVLARIVGQIASPVRWDLCLETMPDLGVTGILEMPPAGTLTGIAKRALKGVETFALKTPDQLDDARAFVQQHGEASPHRHHPDLADGRLARPRAPSTVAEQAADADVARRRARRSATSPASRDRTSVVAAHGGQVVEWLVEDGDLVSPGQPLLRLHPEGAA